MLPHEVTDLVEELLESTWKKRIPFFSVTRGKEVAPGVYRQRAPLFFWALMALALVVMFMGYFLALPILLRRVDPETIFAVLLLCVPSTWLFLFSLSYAVGASVTEYRDRVEVRRFFRTKVLYYEDIADLGFAERGRGPYSFSLVVSNGSMPEEWVSPKERAKAFPHVLGRRANSVTVFLRNRVFRFPITGTHAVFYVAQVKKPLVFRSFAKIISYRKIVPVDEVFRQAIALNARVWNIPVSELERSFQQQPKYTQLLDYPDLSTENVKVFDVRDAEGFTYQVADEEDEAR